MDSRYEKYHRYIMKHDEHDEVIVTGRIVKFVTSCHTFGKAIVNWENKN